MNSNTKKKKLSPPLSEKEKNKVFDSREENYKRVFNNSRDAIYIFTFEGNILDVNSKFVALCGYNKKELAGIKVSDLFPQFVKTKESSERVKKLKKGKNVPTFETVLLTKRGTEKTVEVAVTSLSNCYGHKKVIQSNIRDISSRKKRELKLSRTISQLEQTLKKSEAKYSALVEKSQDGVTIIQDGLIKFTNKSLSRILGYSKQELLQKTFEDFISPDMEAKSRADRKKKPNDSKLPAVYETKVPHKNGKITDIEIRITPIEHEGREAKLYMVRDITKQKKDHSELIHYHEHLEHLVQKKSADLGATQHSLAKAQSISHIGSWEMDLSSGYTQCSDEFFRIFQYNQKIFDGNLEKLFLSRIHPEDREKIFDSKKNALKTFSIRSIEFRAILPDSSVKYIWADSEPVRDNKGKKTGIVGVVHDITERKYSEDHIKGSLEEKEILLREVHHRSKNNMQVISSLLNLQADTSDLKTQKILNDAQNRIRSMALIHEKLYHSQDLGHINIDSYIRTLVSDLFKSFGVGMDRIECIFKIDDLLLDLTRAIPCGLVINELISNTLEHAFTAGEKGRIFISIKQAENKDIHLEISDTGKGLPSPSEASKTKTLGLKLVRTLVTNQLKGTVTFTGKSGTTANISFPGA